MKLFVAPTSPYARKTLVFLHEKGAADRVEVVRVDPWSDPPELHGVAPAGKVPVLVTGEGALSESWAICAHLDVALAGPSLVPDDPAARFACLRLAGLAQGLMDAAFAAVIETRRPAGEQSPGWIARQVAAVRRLVAALEAGAVDLERPFDLGALSVATALAYLDFRHGDLGWRQAAPVLARWQDGAAARPSLKATAFA
ncbi:MAG: glutathione S-transferase N-terminal domain-containing protein [Rhodospirillaceae bacterium]|nr:glutathione S-transferase N-terminal domain-containing protein [Rhodospirillaceae bacterium]